MHSHRFYSTQVITVLLLVFCLSLNIDTVFAQIMEEDTSVFNLPEGFSRTKIYSDYESRSNVLVATLIKSENSEYSKMKFISRKTFPGEFTFENIEKQCLSQNQNIVLQAAAAFTPDYKVIEGYAIQDGKLVGQDSFLGENENLMYKGVVFIKNGRPEVVYPDSLKDWKKFGQEAIRQKYSLFQQVAAIVDGKINIQVNLPRIHKRRFLVGITENNQREFGVISFIVKTSFRDAVSVLKNLETDNFRIDNAVYLDMGGLSEGYIYDDSGKKYLIGDPGKDINIYTNVIVMYTEQIRK